MRISAAIIALLLLALPALGWVGVGSPRVFAAWWQQGTYAESLLKSAAIWFDATDAGTLSGTEWTSKGTEDIVASFIFTTGVSFVEGAVNGNRALVSTGSGAWYATFPEHSTTNEFTMYSCYTRPTAGVYSYWLTKSGVFASIIDIWYSDNVRYLQYPGGYSTVAASTYTGGVFCAYSTSEGTASNIVARMNGEVSPTSFTRSGGIFPGLNSIGRYMGLAYRPTGALLFTAVWDRKLSDYELDLLDAYAKELLGI